MALPGVVAWALCWIAAAAIYLASPRSTTNRLLALALLVEGAHIGAYNALRLLVATQPLNASAARAVEWAFLTPAALLYLAFLSTVQCPLTRPLDRPVFRKVLVVLAGAWILAWPLLSPRLLQAAVLPRDVPGLGDGLWFIGDRPISDGVNGLYMVVLLFGFAVAWSAYRATREGTASRSRARAYLRAFGLRDAVAVSAYVIFSTSHFVDWPFWAGVWASLAPPIVAIVFVLLLGYGILKTQLFDIDLKVKWTLEKGTVAAVFVAVFFVVSEGAQVLFAGFAESEILGVLAAGALVFILSPLQRLAGRLGDVAMPGVEDTEAYRQERKREVYQASVEELLADGKITTKERRMLGRLQDELGLQGGEASRIEADVREAVGGEAA